MLEERTFSSGELYGISVVVPNNYSDARYALCAGRFDPQAVAFEPKLIDSTSIGVASLYQPIKFESEADAQIWADHFLNNISIPGGSTVGNTQCSISIGRSRAAFSGIKLPVGSTSLTNSVVTEVWVKDRKWANTSPLTQAVIQTQYASAVAPNIRSARTPSSLKYRGFKF